jgi:glycosyltransferase involved in cell wall biosynthesis
VPWQAYRLGRSGRYDIIHVNTSLCPKSAFRDALILLALRLSGATNVLLYIHGWEWHVAEQIGRHRLLRALAAYAFSVPERILVLASAFRDFLVAFGVPRERVAVTRTMFDGGAMLPPGETLPARRQVLLMSRFGPAKGIHETLRGFAQIARGHLDTDLVLAGDGKEMPAVRRTVAELGLQERVLLPGYVRGVEKAHLLNACTVFVIPSYGGEGMPVALLEALAAGVPVITSRAGGIPEVVRHGEHGLILDAITPEHIAQALNDVLSRPQWCRQVGDANRRYAWDRFEAGPVTAEVEQIYRAIAGRSETAPHAR